MTTKTRRDLNLEYWGRIHNMCDAYNKQHGTNIKPQQCIKVDGGKWNVSQHPFFDTDPSEYSLAVAIIENKPVFYGDDIYFKQDGARVTVVPGSTINHKAWTLTPPKKKRTFELNGQQLPCPTDIFDDFMLDVFGEYFCFKSVDDINKVKKAILDVLKNARAKD